MTVPKKAGRDREDRAVVAGLACLCLIAGAAAGLVGAVFRLALERADVLRDDLNEWAHGRTGGAAIVIGACAATTAAAAWLVSRFSPEARGSGIPNVETALAGENTASTTRLIPVKFAGGVLAIGGGLALGREGPTVQMGATIGQRLGTLFRQSPEDCRVLLAAGAGAGLATAFNAPIAGAVFVLEELVRRFETRIAIAALGASASAIAVARLLLGSAPDFRVAPQPYAGAGAVPAYLALGAVAGLLGVAYNRSILGALSVSDRLGRWPAPLRAAAVGGAVGLLAWFAPGVVGGGDPITQRLLTAPGTVAAVALVFALRFGLGPVSYAAGTPGGLFAPMLALGAQSGFLVARLCGSWLPGTMPPPSSLAVVGMAAFFTAVVRAPLTGVVLVTEMTGSFSLMFPMLGASFAALAVATLLREPPIYDSLRNRK